MPTLHVRLRPTSELYEEYGKLVRYHPRMDGADYATATELVEELTRRGADVSGLSPLPLAPALGCRLRPLADHVVILPEVVADVTAGGIIKPDSAKEVPMQGTVLAVGPGEVLAGLGTRVPAVAVGDVVLFGRYSGLEVMLEGQRVLIMRETDILGVRT